VWHAHDDTDEFVVPKGTRHKPSSDDGAHILMIEPSGTPTVGDRHEEVPDHVDVTTGHAVGGAQVRERRPGQWAVTPFPSTVTPPDDTV
jgi:hypothetical protein